jgi:hypothetical protein
MILDTTIKQLLKLLNMPFYLFNEPPGYNEVLFFDNDIEKSKYLESKILEYKSLRIKFTGTIKKIEKLFDSIYPDMWNEDIYIPYKYLESDNRIFDEKISELDLKQKFRENDFYAVKIISIYYKLMEKFGKDLIIKEFPNEVFDLKFIESMIKFYEEELNEAMEDYNSGNYVEYKEELPKMTKWEKLAEAEEIMTRIQNKGYY